MIRIIYSVGHYPARTKDVDTDSPSLALVKLAEMFNHQEGSRNVTPSEAYPLSVDFERLPSAGERAGGVKPEAHKPKHLSGDS